VSRAQLHADEQALAHNRLTCDKKVENMTRRAKNQAGHGISYVRNVVGGPDGNISSRAHRQTAQIGAP